MALHQDFFVSLLLFSTVVHVQNNRAQLQFNLHWTDWKNLNEKDALLRHDCLRVDGWEDIYDIYEMTSYCLSERPTKWKIETNNINGKFTFQQLAERNITSEQLYHWSAPMDLLEDYQDYLDQLPVSTNTSLANSLFYNCTPSRFGPLCQYFFEDYGRSYTSLNGMIYTFSEIFQANIVNQTCYVDLSCDVGFKSLCIGWIEICDGIIQCMGGIDEEYCWQLESNECEEDEYRCKNGHCIPKDFLNDDIHAPDCLDDSDEQSRTVSTIDAKNPKGPVFKLEDKLSLKFTYGFSSVKIPPGFEQYNHDCYFSVYFKKDFYNEQPETVSDICWLAINCYYYPYRVPMINCSTICANDECKNIIHRECPDMFYMPNGPMAFGHVYFAYNRSYLLKQNNPFEKPEYVCYNEQLCSGFSSNIRSFIVFNKTTCILLEDFLSTSHLDDIRSFSDDDYRLLLLHHLEKCNTILRNDSIVCNQSNSYQCQNSSKCITKNRLGDGKYDCNYEDDEWWNSTEHFCLIQNPQHYVLCNQTKQCISRKLLNNERCHCEVDGNYGLCVDNPSQTMYIEYHISFPTICDKIKHLKPISVDGRYETDESECEQWSCNNVYTRCNGIWECNNGEDELDCYPRSIINCSHHSYVCFSVKTYDYVCLESTKINDGQVDCLGAIDEPTLCPDYIQGNDAYRFCCNVTANSHSIPYSYVCDRKMDCDEGDDEHVCRHFRWSRPFDRLGICWPGYPLKMSDAERFACTLFGSLGVASIKYFALDQISELGKHNANVMLPSSSSTRTLSKLSNGCHRSPIIRIWSDNENNHTIFSCLCPPGFYGDRCQFQRDRVSLTLRFRTYSDSWSTPFLIVVSLIDVSDERNIHSSEQFTYLSVINCRTKFKIDLLYSTQPRNQSIQYFIHIDVYEKLSLSYRGSVLLFIPFPFLPVQHVVRLVNIPHTSHTSPHCSTHQCLHGQCVQYFDHSNNGTFCRCQSGWSGRFCNITRNCTCSSDSLCIGVLTNYRSICLCPPNKWGSRCLLHNKICQANGTCHNGGQCISTDIDVISKKKFVCLCPKDFFGDLCEITQNQLILSFEKQLILPRFMLVHFIEVQKNAPPEHGSTFKTIPLNRNPVIIYWPRRFDIVLVEFLPHQYYLIFLRNHTTIQSNSVQKNIVASNRCPNISEIFNQSLLQLHLIRRIKYYHLPCRQTSPQLPCFYDHVHLCLCYEFHGQRQANCLEYNHQLERNCRGHSNCQHGASCLQDSVNCPKTSMCICPPCFYGTLCQFSSNTFGLTLDAILSDYIQVQASFQHQPVIVHVSIALTVVITIIGLINGICSLMTFTNEKLRKTGCGVYLLGSSITSLCTTIILLIKFCILFLFQTRYITDRLFLNIQCRSIDFLLRSGLHLDQWYNACVAIERAITTIQGINFAKAKSRRIAKRLIPILTCLIIVGNIHEMLYRRLLDDGSNDQQRTWCVLDYSNHLQNYNLAINILHFGGPFFINLFAALIIIFQAARLRARARAEQSYQRILLKQFQQHQHLLTAPLVLVILAVPRLIILFVTGCMETTADTWLFLIGYFISFLPPMLIFFVFVVPSRAYKKGFYETLNRYRRSFQRRFRSLL